VRREELYLADIVEAADAIEHFSKRVQCKDFAGDELRRSVILQKLILIGDAAPGCRWISESITLR
jgi:uncharacterized protein with HEPN domain